MNNEQRTSEIGQALVELDTAIDLLTQASERILQVVGRDHDTFKSTEQANERARVARAKVEIIMRRLST